MKRRNFVKQSLVSPFAASILVSGLVIATGHAALTTCSTPSPGGSAGNNNNTCTKNTAGKWECKGSCELVVGQASLECDAVTGLQNMADTTKPISCYP